MMKINTILEKKSQSSRLTDNKKFEFWFEIKQLIKVKTLMWEEKFF